MYELLCLASHTSTLDPLLLYHTHVYMHLCFVSVQLLNWVIRLLSFSSVHSGVQIFTSHSIVFTPLLHMTQWLFAFLPITPPSAHFVFVSLYFHLLCSLPLFLLPPCMWSQQNMSDHTNPLHCPDCSCVICWANTYRNSAHKCVFSKEKGRGFPR